MSKREQLVNAAGGGPAGSIVAWHEVECQGYTADLPLWLALAEHEAGPVLDVGAGTGRVALELAAVGHDVTALDVDAELLAELEARAAGLPVRTVCGDAQDFVLGPFGLIVVPMQTLQLLADRPGFWRSARASLKPGGLVAVAIADELVEFDGADLPEPDVGERDGRRYVSQPTAVRLNATHARIERLRTVDGGPPTADVIVLALVDAPALACEIRAAGLTPIPGKRILPTADHVGSSVVMARC